MENIVLIGMPSSGKSTAGAILAEKIGYGLIDSDKLIRALTGETLPELIGEHGAEGFIKIEEQINAGLEVSRCVIATGGSVIYGDAAMKSLQKRGTVVYLRLGAEEIKRRIPDYRSRGVVMRGNLATLDALYRERVPLYERYAEITVDCDGKSAEETAEAIRRALGL